MAAPITEESIKALFNLEQEDATHAYDAADTASSPGSPQPTDDKESSLPPRQKGSSDTRLSTVESPLSPRPRKAELDTRPLTCPEKDNTDYPGQTSGALQITSNVPALSGDFDQSSDEEIELADLDLSLPSNYQAHDVFWHNGGVLARDSGFPLLYVRDVLDRIPVEASCTSTSDGHHFWCNTNMMFKSSINELDKVRFCDGSGRYICVDSCSMKVRMFVNYKESSILFGRNGKTHRVELNLSNFVLRSNRTGFINDVLSSTSKQDGIDVYLTGAMEESYNCDEYSKICHSCWTSIHDSGQSIFDGSRQIDCFRKAEFAKLLKKAFGVYSPLAFCPKIVASYLNTVRDLFIRVQNKRAYQYTGAPKPGFVEDVTTRVVEKVVEPMQAQVSDSLTAVQKAATSVHTTVDSFGLKPKIASTVLSVRKNFDKKIGGTDITPSDIVFATLTGGAILTIVGGVYLWIRPHIKIVVDECIEDDSPVEDFNESMGIAIKDSLTDMETVATIFGGVIASSGISAGVIVALMRCIKSMLCWRGHYYIDETCECGKPVKSCGCRTCPVVERSDISTCVNCSFSTDMCSHKDFCTGCKQWICSCKAVMTDAKRVAAVGGLASFIGVSTVLVLVTRREYVTAKAANKRRKLRQLNKQISEQLVLMSAKLKNRYCIPPYEALRKIPDPRNCTWDVDEFLENRAKGDGVEHVFMYYCLMNGVSKRDRERGATALASDGVVAAKQDSKLLREINAKRRTLYSIIEPALRKACGISRFEELEVLPDPVDCDLDANEIGKMVSRASPQSAKEATEFLLLTNGYPESHRVRFSEKVMTIMESHKRSGSGASTPDDIRDLQDRDTYSPPASPDFNRFDADYISGPDNGKRIGNKPSKHRSRGNKSRGVIRENANKKFSQVYSDAQKVVPRMGMSRLESARDNATFKWSWNSCPVAVCFRHNGRLKKIGHMFFANNRWVMVHHVFAGCGEVLEKTDEKTFHAIAYDGMNIYYAPFQFFKSSELKRDPETLVTFDAPSLVHFPRSGLKVTKDKPEAIDTMDSLHVPYFAFESLDMPTRKGQAYEIPNSWRKSIDFRVSSVTLTTLAKKDANRGVHSATTYDGVSGAPVLVSNKAGAVSIIGAHSSGGIKNQFVKYHQGGSFSCDHLPDQTMQRTLLCDNGMIDYGALVSGPVTDGFFHTRPLEHLRLMGRSVLSPQMPVSGSWAKSCNKEAHRFFGEHGFDVDDLGYGRSRQTLASSRNMFDKMDFAFSEFPECDGFSIDDVVDDVMKHLSSLPSFGECLEPVNFSVETSPDRIVKNAYGVANKGEWYSCENGFDQAYVDMYGTSYSYVNFCMANKIEILPAKKLSENRLRGFMAYPVTLNSLHHYMYGEFLRACKSVANDMDHVLRVGFTQQHGGFKALCRSLAGYATKSGDKRTFDGRMRWWMRLAESYIVYTLGNYSHLTWECFLIDAWRDTFSPVVSASGEIIIRWNCNPSGRTMTSLGGCIYNLLCFSFCCHTRYGRSLTSLLLSRILRLNIYSDDDLHGFFTKNHMQIVPWTAEQHALDTAKFGFEIKPESVRETFGANGQQFLGLEYREVNGEWEVHFELERAIAINIFRSEKPGNCSSAAVASCYLMAFSEHFEIFRRYALLRMKICSAKDSMILSGIPDMDLSFVPTRTQAQQLWLGYECDGVGILNNYIQDMTRSQLTYKQFAALPRHSGKPSSLVKRAWDQRLASISTPTPKPRAKKSKPSRDETQMLQSALLPKSEIEGHDDLMELYRVPTSQKSLPIDKTSLLASYFDPIEADRLGFACYPNPSAPGTYLKPMKAKFLSTMDLDAGDSVKLILAQNSNVFAMATRQISGSLIPISNPAREFTYTQFFKQGAQNLHVAELGTAWDDDVYVVPQGTNITTTTAPSQSLPVVMGVDGNPSSNPAVAWFSTFDDDTNMHLLALPVNISPNNCTLSAGSSGLQRGVTADVLANSLGAIIWGYDGSSFTKVAEGYNLAGESAAGVHSSNVDLTGYTHLCFEPIYRDSATFREIALSSFNARVILENSSVDMTADDDGDIFLVWPWSLRDEYQDKMTEYYIGGAGINLKNVANVTNRGGTAYVASGLLSDFYGSFSSTGTDPLSLVNFPGSGDVDMAEGLRTSVAPRTLIELGSRRRSYYMASNDRVVVVSISAPAEGNQTFRVTGVGNFSYQPKTPIDSGVSTYCAKFNVSKALCLLPPVVFSTNGGHEKLFKQFLSAASQAAVRAAMTMMVTA